MVAQPGGDQRGPGLLERQAADRVHDLDAALAGAGHTFADDVNYLPRVGKSDSACAVTTLRVRVSMRPCERCGDSEWVTGTWLSSPLGSTGSGKV